MGGNKKSKKELKRTTTKKERQAIKEARKTELLKTREERAAEIQDIKNSLLEWGVTEQFSSVRQLYQVMDEYVETGEPVSNSIPWPEAPPQPQGRNIVYLFPRRRGNRCTCDLVVRDGSEYLGQTQSRKTLPELKPNDVSKAPGPGPGNVDDDEIPPLIDESSPVPLPGNPIENFAEALAAEMEKVQADRSDMVMPIRPEEARKLAEKIVPSAEEIQKELDRVYLHPDQDVKTVSNVEIIE